MSDKTGIEWTDATWNPVTGCTKVSPGCDHCYAETIAHRFAGTPAYPNGFEPTLHPERLEQPLRWKKPRRIFVNSMADLFHDQVEPEYIAQVWATMALAPQHTFQILTKRHARMRSLLNNLDFCSLVRDILRRQHGLSEVDAYGTQLFPLHNVWGGVSVEDDHWAGIRIPALLETPLAVRFLSCEPLLGPLDLTGSGTAQRYWLTGRPHWGEVERGPVPMQPLVVDPSIDWVIVGGESGPGARLMQLDWARSLRDQCVAAGVPFHFKQFGEWAPTDIHSCGIVSDPKERQGEPYPDERYPGLDWRRLYERVGKKAAGRELDGRTWDEYPAVSS